MEKKKNTLWDTIQMYGIQHERDIDNALLEVVTEKLQPHFSTSEPIIHYNKQQGGFYQFMIQDQNNHILTYIENGKIYTGKDIKIINENGFNKIENADNKILEESKEELSNKLLTKHDDNKKKNEENINNLLKMQEMRGMLKSLTKGVRLNQQQQEMFRIIKTEIARKENNYINSINSNLNKNIDILNKVHPYMKSETYERLIFFDKNNILNLLKQSEKLGPGYGINNILNGKLNTFNNAIMNINEKKLQFYQHKINNKANNDKIKNEMKSHLGVDYKYGIAECFLDNIINDPKNYPCTLCKEGSFYKDFFIKKNNKVIAFVNSKGHCFVGDDIKITQNNSKDNTVSNCCRWDTGTNQDIYDKVLNLTQYKQQLINTDKGVLKDNQQDARIISEENMHSLSHNCVNDYNLLSGLWSYNNKNYILPTNIHDKLMDNIKDQESTLTQRLNVLNKMPDVKVKNTILNQNNREVNTQMIGSGISVNMNKLRNSQIGKQPNNRIVKNIKQNKVITNNKDRETSKPRMNNNQSIIMENKNRNIQISLEYMGNNSILNKTNKNIGQHLNHSFG